MLRRPCFSSMRWHAFRTIRAPKPVRPELPRGLRDLGREDEPRGEEGPSTGVLSPVLFLSAIAATALFCRSTCSGSHLYQRPGLGTFLAKNDTARRPEQYSPIENSPLGQILQEKSRIQNQSPVEVIGPNSVQKKASLQ